MRSPATSAKKLKPLQLAAIIFFTVSGGPYGLEPLLDFAGKNGALLLLLLTPLFWDIPTILAVLELNSMMPVTGGYYQWVKRALGLRWAFFEGWWTWLYTFVDLAIYPVLFVTYATYFFPHIAACKIPVCLIIIWSSAALNILGIVPIGRISLFLGLLVLTPFLILFGIAVFHNGGVSFPPPSLKGVPFSSLGMGLYTVMWNFSGWDSITTYAEEVDKPVRSYLISVAVAFVLVVLIYAVTVWTAQTSGMNFAALSEQGFPALGYVLSGRWLGALIAAGGMASALGLYSAVLLSVSRVPQVMAEDQLLPARLRSEHPKFKTPYLSIIICSVVVSILVWFTFTDLIVIDITLYGAGLFLEFIALIVLRIKAPYEQRPFKIPLAVPGLCLLLLLPVVVYFIALTGTLSAPGKGFSPAWLAVGALGSAEIIWRLIVWKKNQSASKHQ